MKSILTSLVLLGPAVHGATLTGLWTFDNPANPGEATIGNDLAFEGTAPSYSATLSDDSGTSQVGVITTVLGSSNRIGVNHGIAPNGGGAFVNQYSLVVDLFSPAASRDSWRTIFQTNTGNSNDGEFFIRNNNNTIGVADLGYSSGEIDETSWTRLVLTFDLTQAGNDAQSYLDGVPFHSHPGDPGVDGRFSLDPSLFLFTDNDGDDSPLHVGTVAIYDGVLTAAEVAGLGTAGTAIPEPSAMALLSLGGLLARRRRSQGKRSASV